MGRLDFKSSLRGGGPVVGEFDSHTLPPKNIGQLKKYRILGVYLPECVELLFTRPRGPSPWCWCAVQSLLKSRYTKNYLLKITYLYLDFSLSSLNPYSFHKSIPLLNIRVVIRLSIRLVVTGINLKFFRFATPIAAE